MDYSFYLSGGDNWGIRTFKYAVMAGTLRVVTLSCSEQVGQDSEGVNVNTFLVL